MISVLVMSENVDTDPRSIMAELELPVLNYMENIYVAVSQVEEFQLPLWEDLLKSYKLRIEPNQEAGHTGGDGLVGV